MGIQGLLPFLKAIHTPVNIADFQGCSVAIDAYCWLHRGAFSCAEKLALGEKTDQYVYYCMKYVEYMLRKNLKPILVFDGCHLKSKADVEKTRRERRELHRKKAAQFLREGKRNEAKECLQRCIDVTPQMALELMNACRDRGVDCIVAPYEADAQLAFLNLSGIADIIVTEDSDLLLFGCEKIIFKMDFFGNGTLIEKARLNEVLSIKGGFYTFEKFRHMCILSGCDYLPSIPGIGLARACKVMKTARQPDIKQLLKKLSTYLKSNLTVTEEYIEGFIRAENTFLYQLVFNPLNRKLCPLTPYPPELDSCGLDYAGEYIQEEKAFQIALGNVDIHNYKCISYFDPDTFVPKSAARPKFRHELSIWDKNYRVKSGSPCKEIQDKAPSLKGKEQTIVVRPLKTSPTKKCKPVDLTSMKSNEELVSLYGDGRENACPDLKTVSRHLFKDVLPSSPTEAADDKKGQSSGINTPEKTTNLQREDTGGDFDSVHQESDNSDDEKSKRCLKRKMPLTPSRPSAADIGEDAFRASDSSAQDNSDKSQTPSKGRNIFAVQTSSAKVPKFDLDTPAVHVKSRYFVPGGCSRPTVRAYNASPSKQSLQSPKTKAPSSSAQKSIQPNNQKSIRQMFENAPPCSQQSGEGVTDSKPVIKTGMYRYLNPSGSELPCAKDSVTNVANKSSGQVKGHREDTCKPSPSRDSLQQPLSCFQKFQSSFLPSASKKNQSAHSSGSAFDWSKNQSGSVRANSKLRNSSVYGGSQFGCGPDKKYIKLEEGTSDIDIFNSSHTESEDVDSENCSEQKCQIVHEASNSSIDSAKQQASVGSRPRQCSTGASCDKAELVDDNQSEDVTELQLYSYDDFLTSLGGDKLCGAKDDVTDLGNQACNFGRSEDQTDADDFLLSTPGSASQAICGDSLMTDTDSQVNHSDSQVLDMSVSLDEDNRLSGKDSRGTISCSVEDECYPVIDLTDGETDSQVSSVSSVSQSSKSSGIRQSRCRVSGLSRCKSSAKTPSPGIAGQRSIKDLMSKFQYRRSTVPVSLTE